MSLGHKLGTLACTLFVLSTVRAEPPAGFPGQDHSRGNGPPVEYGESVAHGNGSFTPYGTVIAGVPRAIGVRFAASTMTGQPSAASDGTWDVVDEDGNVVWHCCGHERVLEVPENVRESTPFTHIVVNWNPEGHIPPGVFDVPHYDFHFYTIDEATRTSIEAPVASEMCDIGGTAVPVDCETYATLTEPLPEDQMPPDYIRPGAVEPGMGDHLLDPFGSGLNAMPFSHTFIFGAYDGNLSFFEPMITVEYLRTRPRRCFPIRLPEALPEAGWAPSQYCIEFQPGRELYSVSLESFVYLPQSAG